MKDAAVAASPLSAAFSKTTTARAPFVLWCLGAAACLLMLVANVYWREHYTGDEGFYGVTAKNMLRSSDYWLRPSYLPAGDFDADKEGFAHPPFNSYFYAVALWAARGSLAGIDVLNVACFAALLVLAYRLVRRFDETAAVCAVVLLAASPSMAGFYSFLEAEPLMTTFGLAALCCAVGGGFARGEKHRFFLSGLCLGFSFALKLWLFGPLLLAVGAAVLVRIWQTRPAAASVVTAAALFFLGAVIPAGLHLAAIAVVHPGDVKFWLHDIYFGIFTHAGISGSKLAGNASPTEWSHPIWYYGAVVYRDHFFLLPVVLFGLRSVWRDPLLKGAPLFILLAGAAGLAPLSLMKVKEPLYILACVVFLYLLAGCCLAALVRRVRSTGRIDAPSFWGTTAITGALLAGVLLAYARGLKPDDLTREFVLAHTATLAGILAIAAAAGWKRSAAWFERGIYGGAAVALLALFAFQFATRNPRDAAIARAAQPYIEPNAPAALSMVASNFKGYQLYTFRRGVYWHELNLEQAPATLLESAPFQTVRAFIVSPADQARPEMAPWLRWLESHTTEKTVEIDRQLRQASGFRVFVRELPTPAVGD